MKNPNLTVWAAVGILVLSFAACDRDDDQPCDDPTNTDCPNYDPCFGKDSVTATFQFLARYGVGADAPWYPETKFIGSPIRFSAIDTAADSYTWYLGTDTFTGNSNVQLEINQLNPGMYSAGLVLEKEPDLYCFPDDDGRDSLMLYFEKVEICDGLTIGKFRGIEQSLSSDSIEIEVFLGNITTGVSCAEPMSIYFMNIQGENDTLLGHSNGYGIYSRSFFGGSGSGSLRGEIIVDEATWHTTFNYRLGNVDYEFTGRKME